jgi:hypothetical protein
MGVTDGAFLFDGVDDYLTVTDSVFDTAERTVSLWFYTDSLQSNLVFSGGTGSPNRFYMWPQVDGTIDTQVGSSSAVTSSIGYVTGQWVHYVVVYDGAEVVVFINGEEGSRETNATLSGVGNVNFGSYNGTSNKWDGSLRDMRIISRAITVTEVRELYNATARPDISGTVLHLRPETGLVDQSGNQDPGTFEGNAAVVGRRYEFDAVAGSYCEFADSVDLTPSGGFSISCWYKPGDTALRGILGKSQTFNTGEWAIFQDSTARVFVSFIDETNSGRITYKTTSPVLTAGEWIHIVGTYDGGSSVTGITIYINGVAQGTTSAGGGTFVQVRDTTATLRLGYSNGSECLGDIGEVRVIPSELTAAQVLTLYEGVPGYEPPEPNRIPSNMLVGVEAAHGLRDVSHNNTLIEYSGTDIDDNSNSDSFSLNGTDDHIIIHDQKTGTDISLSFECWFNQNVLLDKVGSVLYGQDVNGGEGTFFGFTRWASGYYLFGDGVNGGNNVTELLSNLPTLGKWNHALFVIDESNEFYCYLNGVLLKQQTLTTTRVTNNTFARIGNRADITDSYDGYIKSAYVYSDAKDAAFAKMRYNKGVPGHVPVGLLGGETVALFPSRHEVGVLPDTVLQLDGSTGVTDQSPAGNDGTYNGGMGVTDGKFVFDGTDDYVESPAVFGGYPFTMSVRFKADTVGGGVVMSVAEENTYYHSIEISGNNLRIRAYDGTSYFATGTTTLIAGVWYHAVAVFRSASDRELYLDGSSEATNTSTENGNIGYTKCRLGVSADTTPFNYFDGEIDDARLITRDVSTAEVTTLHNNDIKDESGSGNDGTLANGAYVGENDEIVFDGVNDEVIVPLSLDGATEISLSIWVKASSTSTGGSNDYLFSFKEGALNNGVDIGQQDSNWRFDLQTSSATSFNLLSSGSVTTDWTHLALTYDGVTLKCYENAVEVINKSVAAGSGISNAYGAGSIGSFAEGLFAWAGSVRDPRAFNRTLTAAEIAFLASAYEVETPNTKGSVLSIVPSYDNWGNATLSAIDFSGNGNVGTLTNMTTGDWVADTDSGGTRALDFDGTDDYVNCGNFIDQPTVMTWSVWFKPNAWNDNDFVIEKGNVFALGQHSSIVGANGGFSFRHGGTWKSVDFAASPTLGEWVYAVAVLNGSALELFVDGDSVASRSDMGGTSPSSFDVNIGGRDTSFPFNGTIDDVLIYDRALSLDEIKALASTRNYFDCPEIIIPPAFTRSNTQLIRLNSGGTL